jgi:hypothetical protein
MTDDQFPVTEIDQPVQLHDGVAPAGNANEIARFRRKIAAYSRADVQWLHECLPVILNPAKNL